MFKELVLAYKCERGKTCFCPNPICSEPTGELKYNIKTCDARSEVTVLKEHWVKKPNMLQIVLGTAQMDCLELVKWWACMKLCKWL